MGISYCVFGLTYGFTVKCFLAALLYFSVHAWVVVRPRNKTWLLVGPFHRVIKADF